MSSRQVLRVLATAMLLVLALVAAGRSTADPLPLPRGEVILIVSGAIAETNAGAVAQFDMAMLEALGLQTIASSTIWTEGVQEFSGVPLKALLARLGAQGSRLKAVALNDYSVDMPLSDAMEEGPILALKQNGRPMSVRDKGPVWVVFPYDADPKWRSQVIYTRSIWQLHEIEVLP